MNRLLICAATETEIAPLKEQLKNARIDLLITGVGMTATAFALGKALGKRSYDLAIQAGICGAFDRNMSPGEIYVVKEDRFAELGAEDHDAFLPIEALGIGQGCALPLKPLLSPLFPADDLPGATAITVNTVHGQEKSIARIRSLFNPHLESMEGAAFFFSCNAVGLPCLQLRSVSNYVEPRNRENWNIPLAVKNLNKALEKLLRQLLQD